MNTVTLKNSYARGKRYLKAIQEARPGSLEPTRRANCFPHPTFPTFARHDPDRSIANALARLFGTDRRAVLEDGQFAVAVNTLINHCGPEVEAIVLSEKLTRKTIMRISRTHPIRQKQEMARVVGGDPVRKAKEEKPPFDTMGYYEVVGRARRAAGSLRAVHRLVTDPGVWAVKAEKLRTPTTEIITQSRELLAVMRMLRAVPGEPVGAKAHTPAVSRPKGRVHPATAIGSALGLIQKNLRDIPQLPSSFRPTLDEKQTIESYILEAANTAEALLTYLHRQ